MELDVPNEADSRDLPWQKVAKAAGLRNREIRYYEYLSGKNESPTKLLLGKLGSQGRTISYLLDVLQKPRVELCNIANTIRHRVTRI